MAVNAASTGPVARVMPTAASPCHHHFSRGPWQGEVDDAALTGNEGTEADLTRALAADEELLLEEEEEEEEGASVSPRSELLETAKLLAAGGIAGAVSKSCTAPLARLTILYQVQGLGQPAGVVMGLSRQLSVRQALQEVVRREGVAALWKGNGVTIVHRLPYSAANFWMYETVNEYWKRHIPVQGPLAVGDVTRRLVSGGIAGITACSLAYPLDLVRTRLAAQATQRYYRGIGHALATIVRDEGPRGLYRGLSATLLQVAPSLAINYAAYETARSAWLARLDRTSPTVGMSLACGSVAGLVSSTATFPLDLVRRRMQLQGQGGRADVYSSYRSALRTIAANEGLRGMYAGILPEYYKVVPGVAIAFCTYELMKRGLDVRVNSGAR